MIPNIFIDDFEITENTEELHAILGRSLIIATRFDKLCDYTAKFIGIKKSYPIVSKIDDFDGYVNKILNKFSILNNNIESLSLGQPRKKYYIMHAEHEMRLPIALQ